ncbi:MAG: flavin-containing monooxygenase [Planctomycetia bacterium]|jgi:thioredoxin reductase
MPAATHADAAARWCVIGAGPSGLTALKNLRAAGIDAECLEREAGIGGNWLFGAATSRVFASTRLISSKTLTAYVDHPMPRDWPAYPDHRQCLDYLRGYADRFGLAAHVRTGIVVETIEPAGGPGRGWRVHVAGGPPRDYAGVVIASGHNHEPRRPEIPGGFAGTLLHAAEYKSPDRPVSIAGRRVLVIGGGNSACDIAVECSRHAARTVHSTRRGYHVVPREIRGRPADLRNERLLKLGLPLWLRRLVSLRAIDREIGLPWRHGLPRPDHRLWESHPIVNSELLAQIDAGAIVPAGDVRQFAGDTVEFADGSRSPFDVVICATGYRTTFPFIDTRLLGANSPGELPRLFMNVLHGSRDDIAVVGLIQPDSGQWGLTDLQSRLVARMAVAAARSPRAAAWLYAARQRPAPQPAIRYLDSPRHTLEVEHFSYQRRLERLIAALDRRLRHDCDRHAPAGPRAQVAGRGR